MKKITYRLCTLLLVVSLVFSANTVIAEEESFVPMTSQEFSVLKEAELLTDDFLNMSANSSVTRAEFLGAVYKLAGYSDITMENPFTDVDDEIDRINQRENQRRELIQEDITYEKPRRRRRFTESEPSSTHENPVKNSFGILKDTIIRTFHPKQAKVTRTQPKENIIYERNEAVDDNPVEDSQEDIIIQTNDDDIVPDHVIKSQKIKKPEIRKIRETNRPYVRKSKESTERLSFDSQRLNRSNWREKLNNLNKTDANKEKKQAPRPKPRQRK